MRLTESDLKAIALAESKIQKGIFKRVDLGLGMIMYKVPSNNPNKYTIRLDIKIDNTEE